MTQIHAEGFQKKDPPFLIRNYQFDPRTLLWSASRPVGNLTIENQGSDSARKQERDKKWVDLDRTSSLLSAFLFGDVAQLEERHNGIVEVVGSIPIVSTIRGKGVYTKVWGQVIFQAQESRQEVDPESSLF